MSEDEKETIIQKIKKLHIKAENAKNIGSEAEANAFAQKVQEMLNKHKLDMSVLQFQDHAKAVIERVSVDWPSYGHEFKDREEPWLAALLNIIARHNQCIIITYKRSNRMLLYGRKIDIESVDYLIKTLLPMARLLGYRAYHKIYEEIRPLDPDERKRILKGYKESWKLGFVTGIREAIDEARRTAEAQSTSGALVRLDSLIEHVFNKVREDNPGITTSASKRTGIKNSEAFMNGHKSGVESMQKQQVRG